MREPIRAVSFLTVAVLAPYSALAGFEGEIETRQVRADLRAIQRVVAGAEPGDETKIATVSPERFVADGGDGVRVQTGTMTLKGVWGRADMDDPGMPGFMIMNFDEGDAYMCRADKRQCLRFTHSDRKAAEARAEQLDDAIREAMKGQSLSPEQKAYLSGTAHGPDDDEGRPVVVEDTGRRETAGGAASRVYKASAGGDVAFAWMTSELPEISRVYEKALELFERSARNRGFAGRARQAVASHGLPMRVQLVESSGGGPVYRSNEITAYRAKPVDDAYVRPPAGWEIKTSDDIMADAARGARPGRPGSARPPHPPVQLPPGVKLPPGVQLPPGVIPPPP